MKHRENAIRTVDKAAKPGGGRLAFTTHCRTLSLV
jgi:hypothetical protein